MASDIRRFEKDVSRILANNMNKTLFQAKRKQGQSILKYVSVDKRLISYATIQTKASSTNLKIELRTKEQKIRPERLKGKTQTRGGTIVSLYEGKPYFFKGFGLQTNRKTGGRFLIGSKNTGKYSDLTSHNLRSSYNTKKSGKKISKPREAFIVRSLPKKIDYFALKEASKLIKFAQEIFAKEMEK